MLTHRAHTDGLHRSGHPVLRLVLRRSNRGVFRASQWVSGPSRTARNSLCVQAEVTVVGLLVVTMVVLAGTWMAAQSRFSIDGSVQLESGTRKSSASDAAIAGKGADKTSDKSTDKKTDSWKSLFKDFRAGSCRASAAPTMPGSSWPARGEAAIAVCRP